MHSTSTLITLALASSLCAAALGTRLADWWRESPAARWMRETRVRQQREADQWMHE